MVVVSSPEAVSTLALVVLLVVLVLVCELPPQSGSPSPTLVRQAVAGAAGALKEAGRRRRSRRLQERHQFS